MSDNKPMSTETIDEFIDVLKSDAPVPGGGGAAGLVAAVGAALTEMVLSLTTGKKKYQEYQSEIDELIPKLDEMIEKLKSGMDKDAEAFYPLSQAYGLPKNTEEELAHREQVLAEALVTASEAPLNLMADILEALKLTSRVAVIGSRLAISDAGVATQCLKAAIYGASLNVYINTKLMKDKAKAAEFDKKADAMIAEAEELATETYATVVKAIRG